MPVIGGATHAFIDVWWTSSWATLSPPAFHFLFFTCWIYCCDWKRSILECRTCSFDIAPPWWSAFSQLRLIVVAGSVALGFTQNVSFPRTYLFGLLSLDISRPIFEEKNTWRWASKGDEDYEDFIGCGYKQTKEIKLTPQLSFLEKLYPNSQTKLNSRLACPFRKHDPQKFNLLDYDACSRISWRSMRHLE